MGAAGKLCGWQAELTSLDEEEEDEEEEGEQAELTSSSCQSHTAVYAIHIQIYSYKQTLRGANKSY